MSTFDINSYRALIPRKEARQSTFRGKPIEWVQQPKTAIIPAVCGDDDCENVGKKNLISYDGQLFTRVEFLKYAFPEYRKYPYRVRFKTDDIFRLGGNQRAKLQYHILAQNFPLVEVSEQDKNDLEYFCMQSDNATSQRWLNRMSWQQGLEKIVSFGASLKVDGKVNGVWCYESHIDDEKATYTGFNMDWEAWLILILHPILQGKRKKLPTQVIVEMAMACLYYNGGKYLTLPKAERNTLVKWIYDCIYDNTTPFPFQGMINGEHYEFTIDFKKDIEIERSYDLSTEMAEYNRTHNAQRAARQVQNRFEQLKGDCWTTAELKAQGFTTRNINTFIKHGLIKRLYQGHYQRILK